jgi:hypothetical protein
MGTVLSQSPVQQKQHPTNILTTPNKKSVKFKKVNEKMKSSHYSFPDGFLVRMKSNLNINHSTKVNQSNDLYTSIGSTSSTTTTTTSGVVSTTSASSIINTNPSNLIQSSQSENYITKKNKITSLTRKFKQNFLHKNEIKTTTTKKNNSINSSSCTPSSFLSSSSSSTTSSFKSTIKCKHEVNNADSCIYCYENAKKQQQQQTNSNGLSSLFLNKLNLIKKKQRLREKSPSVSTIATSSASANIKTRSKINRVNAKSMFIESYNSNNEEASFKMKLNNATNTLIKSSLSVFNLKSSTNSSLSAQSSISSSSSSSASSSDSSASSFKKVMTPSSETVIYENQQKQQIDEIEEHEIIDENRNSKYGIITENEDDDDDDNAFINKYKKKKQQEEVESQQQQQDHKMNNIALLQRNFSYLTINSLCKCKECTAKQQLQKQQQQQQLEQRLQYQQVQLEIKNNQQSNQYVTTSSLTSKQHSKVVIQASTNDLLRCLAHFVAKRCFYIKDLNASDCIQWIKNADRQLLLQGWQEIGFINPANIVFVYLLIRDTLNLNQNSIQTVNEFKCNLLSCLYLAFSYMGNEISYPLKPFIVEENRDVFWQRIIKLISQMSKSMLRVNQDTKYFTEIFNELKTFGGNFTDCSMKDSGSLFKKFQQNISLQFQQQQERLNSPISTSLSTLNRQQQQLKQQQQKEQQKNRRLSYANKNSVLSPQQFLQQQQQQLKNQQLANRHFRNLMTQSCNSADIFVNHSVNKFHV